MINAAVCISHIRQANVDILLYLHLAMKKQSIRRMNICQRSHITDSVKFFWYITICQVQPISGPPIKLKFSLGFPNE